MDRGVQQIPGAVDAQTIRRIEIARPARSALGQRGQLVNHVRRLRGFDGEVKDAIIAES